MATIQRVAQRCTQTTVGKAHTCHVLCDMVPILPFLLSITHTPGKKMNIRRIIKHECRIITVSDHDLCADQV